MAKTKNHDTSEFLDRVLRCKTNKKLYPPLEITVIVMLNEYNAVLRHNKTYMVIPEQNLVSMNTQMISDDGNGVVEYGDLFPADVDIEKDTVETDYVSFLCNQINHPQEQEVIKLLANGFTQAEIAEKMGVSRQRIGQLMNKIRERLRKYAA